MKLSLKLTPRFPPREPRVAVTIEASLLLPGDEVVHVAIRNISSEGFMAEAPVAIPCGSRIGVTLPGCGIVPARVRWSGEGEIGARFHRPLDLERLEQVAAAAAEAGQPLFRSRLVQGPL